jgi:phosphatidylserine synthase
MVLFGKVEGISWNFDGSAGFTGLGIPAQLVVHYSIEGVGKSSGKLTTYIYCIVSTIDLFNFSLTSQSVANWFFLGFQSLNTYSSLVLLWVVTLTSTMLTKVTINFGSRFKFCGLTSFILEHTLHFIESWAICQFVTHYSTNMTRIVYWS